MKAVALFLFSTTKETDISNHEYVIGKYFLHPVLCSTFIL